MTGLPDGTRVAISGSPTPDEVTAVLVALDQALTSDTAQRPRRSGWQEAARREAVGGRLIRSPSELQRP